MNTETLLLALTIAGSSFWGSWHCAAMCGPMASIAAGRQSLAHYHLGRGLSYLLIGACGGCLGSFFLASEFQHIKHFSSALFAAVLIILGIQTARGSDILKMIKFPQPLLRIRPQASVFTLGLFSIFLPCGWLYSYVLAAVATRSPWGGACVMFLFWIGGLPALSALSIFMEKSVRTAPQRNRAAAGMILTLAGIYSLFSFYYLK